jgi:hypothetical protein
MQSSHDARSSAMPGKIEEQAVFVQAEPCIAEFTLNGQHANFEVAGGGMVTLQADEAEATRYQWEVFGSSSRREDWKLRGEAQARATLVVVAPGAYVIQLAVEKGESKAVGRRLLWVSMPQRESLLPATGEPLHFSGDEARSELPAGTAAGVTSEKARHLLATLARDAAALIRALKAQGQLPVRPGASDEEIEAEIAIAWLLAEVARRGLVVSSAEIMQAVTTALHARTP